MEENSIMYTGQNNLNKHLRIGVEFRFLLTCHILGNNISHWNLTYSAYHRWLFLPFFLYEGITSDILYFFFSLNHGLIKQLAFHHGRDCQTD